MYNNNEDDSEKVAGVKEGVYVSVYTRVRVYMIRARKSIGYCTHAHTIEEFAALHNMYIYICVYIRCRSRVYFFIYLFIILFIYLFIFVVAALPQVLSLRVYGIRIFIERKKHARTDDYYTQLLITQLEWKIFFFVLLYFQRSHSCFFFSITISVYLFY